MSETNYFRLIEAYFEGKATPDEKAMLEAKVKSDPLVEAEFNLQQNIVKGISNARKLELKSRLASIDIPTHTGILTGSGAQWLAGTIAGVTIFGSVLYWTLSTFELSIKPLDLKAQQEITFNLESIPDFPEIAVKKNVVTDFESTKSQVLAPDLTEEKKEINEDDPTAKVQPQALMSYDDDKFFTNQNEEELERLSSREIAHSRADKTEIEFLDAVDNKDEYHYRYFNSKLFLYGDFNDTPYQIIELNDKGRKQLFLSYNDEVYKIKDNTTEIAELKTLEDDLLRMEIQLIVEE